MVGGIVPELEYKVECTCTVKGLHDVSFRPAPRYPHLKVSFNARNFDACLNKISSCNWIGWKFQALIQQRGSQLRLAGVIRGASGCEESLRAPFLARGQPRGALKEPSLRVDPSTMLLAVRNPHEFGRDILVEASHCERPVPSRPVVVRRRQRLGDRGVRHPPLTCRRNAVHPRADQWMPERELATLNINQPRRLRLIETSTRVTDRAQDRRQITRFTRRREQQGTLGD